MRERKRERDLVSHRFLTFLFQLTLMKFGKERIPFGAPFVKRKNVISLSEQIQQLSLVKSNLADIKGQSVTEKLISKSLFFISTGSNDLFGYYHSNSSFSKEAFLSSLELAYEKHLKVILFSNKIQLNSIHQMYKFFIA